MSMAGGMYSTCKVKVYFSSVNLPPAILICSKTVVVEVNLTTFYIPPTVLVLSKSCVVEVDLTIADGEL